MFYDGRHGSNFRIIVDEYSNNRWLTDSEKGGSTTWLVQPHSERLPFINTMSISKSFWFLLRSAFYGSRKIENLSILKNNQRDVGDGSIISSPKKREFLALEVQVLNFRHFPAY